MQSKIEYDDIDKTKNFLKKIFPKSDESSLENSIIKSTLALEIYLSKGFSASDFGKIFSSCMRSSSRCSVNHPQSTLL